MPDTKRYTKRYTNQTRPASVGAAKNLNAADRLIGRRELDQARQVLDKARADSSLSGRALRAALTALLAERDGHAEQAAAGFDEVLRCPVPLPGALLAAAQYFCSTQQAHLALACCARLTACGSAQPKVLKALLQKLDSHYPGLKLPMVSAASGTQPMRPHTQLKQRLLSRLDLTDALLAFSSQSSPPRITAAVRRPLRGLLDYAHNGGAEVFHEIAPARTLQMHSPEILGQARQPPFEAFGRALFCAALPGAVVAGRSSLIEMPDAVLFDYQADEMEKLPAVLTCDSQGFEHREGMLTLLRTGRQPTLELDEAIMMMGASSMAFGHWIGEHLGKLFQLDHAGLTPAAPVLIDAGMPETHRQALEFFSYGRREIIEVQAQQAVRVSRLWVASTLAYAPFFPQPGIELLNERLCAGIDVLPQLTASVRRTDTAVPRKPRRLFLARRPDLHRKMSRQDELQATCAEYGFTSVYLETLSFEQQLALVSGATHIVGPAGSALMFSFFYARPGARILDLHPPWLVETPSLTSIAAARGVDVLVVLGDCVREMVGFRGNSDFSITPQQLHEAFALWKLKPHPRRHLRPLLAALQPIARRFNTGDAHP